MALTPGRKTLVVAVGIGAVVLGGTALLGARTAGHWRSHAPGPRAGVPRLCAANHGGSLESLIGFTEAFLAFTPEQREAWDDLTGALRAGRTSVETACRELTAAGPATSAPERLAQVERLMATGLDVIRDLRPAFERFYVVLTEAQRQALDDLLSHHRH